MTKQELVNLYNDYISGNLNMNQEEMLWEGVLNFSHSFLCYINTNEETKQDILEDLIYSLMTMNDYFKQVKNFNQLRNQFVSKAKHLAKKYNKWESKEQGNYGEN